MTMIGTSGSLIMRPTTNVIALLMLGGALLMAPRSVAAFHVPQPSHTHSGRRGGRAGDGVVLRYQNDLPSYQDVANDEFTKQVYHGSSIVRELSASLQFYDELSSGNDNNNDTNNQNNDESNAAKERLSQLLTAQLSHQDGIRGFFAAYLTGVGDTTAADQEQVPALLASALKQTPSLEHLAASLCMDLIMSTAMASTQKDRALATNSATVAQRAKRILSSLKGSIHMVRNCEAILVAAGTDAATENNTAAAANQTLVQFWSAIFDQYAYTAQQRKDIAKAFAGIV